MLEPAQISVSNKPQLG